MGDFDREVSVGLCDIATLIAAENKTLAAQNGTLRAERLILARALLDEPAGRAEAFSIAKRVREEGT